MYTSLYYIAYSFKLKYFTSNLSIAAPLFMVIWINGLYITDEGNVTLFFMFHEYEQTVLHISHTHVVGTKLWNRKCDLYMRKYGKILS
jgi:hypothetical protein